MQKNKRLTFVIYPRAYFVQNIIFIFVNEKMCIHIYWFWYM